MLLGKEKLKVVFIFLIKSNRFWVTTFRLPRTTFLTIKNKIMKKEELEIGSDYVHIYHPELKGRFIGVDRMGDPVLMPITDESKVMFSLHSEKHEEIDPACVEGSFGLTMHGFLRDYKKM